MKLKVAKASNTLYRVAKRGQFIYSTFDIEGSKFRARTGHVGGKEKVGAWTECKAKNVGRANETTPEQQATDTVKRKMEKLVKDRGYAYTQEEALVKFNSKAGPMLAITYEPGHTKIKFPAFVQPKLNGLRCDGDQERLMSRGNRPFKSVPHIQYAVTQLLRGEPETTHVDGELYNHEKRELLNEMVSLCKKQKPTEKQLQRSKEIVQLHLYDCFWMGEPSREGMDQDSRLTWLAKQLKKNGTSGYIKLVPTKVVRNQAELDAEHIKNLEAGYEGSIIRTTTGVYIHDRSPDLIKYKPRFSHEFRIVEALDGKGKNKGVLSRIWVEVTKTEKVEGPTSVPWTVTKGKRFKTNVKGPMAERKKLWLKAEQMKGKLCTVSYAYITSHGAAFWPYLEMIHWDNKKI